MSVVVKSIEHSMEHVAWSGRLEARGQRSEARGQRSEVRRQRTEDGRQRTASQMVNLSSSQMVMSGLNDELTV